MTEEVKLTGVHAVKGLSSLQGEIFSDKVTRCSHYSIPTGKFTSGSQIEAYDSGISDRSV